MVDTWRYRHDSHGKSPRLISSVREAPHLLYIAASVFTLGVGVTQHAGEDH